VNLLANEKMDKYDKKIAELESEGREIIRNAKIKADQRAESIIDETNVKVEQMLKRAQEEIDREKAKAIVEMREQIAAMAIFAAEKIIERQLDMSGQEELLAGILDEAGRVSWRN
jgi:F-type H+-transporting ATPase subunit b